MKEYTKIRVGLKSHLPSIKGAPLSMFIWMSMSCDKCGMFYQSLEQVSNGTGYTKQALVSAADILKKKKFIKCVATVSQIPAYWIMKHNHLVEAQVTLKGSGYLIEESTVLKNLGLKKGDLTCG